MTSPLVPERPASGPVVPRCNFTTSLDNLDPLAKEFLVDAGVVLENISPAGKFFFFI
jgi:hypothetical protein